MRYLFPLIGMTAVLALASAFPMSATAGVFDIGERVDQSMDLDVLSAPTPETVAIKHDLADVDLVGAVVGDKQLRPADGLTVVNTEYGGAVGEYDAGTIALI